MMEVDKQETGSQGAACVAPGQAEDGDEDVVVRELDVYVANDAIGAQVCLLSHPLRPPWRPYQYKGAAMRMKPHSKRLEVDIKVHKAANYNLDADSAEGVPGCKPLDKLTLRSTKLEHMTVLAAGRLTGDRLVLLPIDYSLQLRPDLQHLNAGRKEEEKGAEGGEGPGLKAVEMQMQKRETERQQQARLNSYAFMAAREANEEWVQLNSVHLPDLSPVPASVLQKLSAIKGGKAPHNTVTRQQYLAGFAPSLVSASPHHLQASGMDMSGAQDGGTEAVAGMAGMADPLSITDEAKVAFAKCLKLLFMRHSVVSLDNIRQWITDPKLTSGPGMAEMKTAAPACASIADLPDRPLHEVVLGSSGLELVCIRRTYVLKVTGRPEDAFRQVVIDLLQDKDGFKKGEAVELARPKGIAITDTIYNRVVKDLCVSRDKGWHLKTGADF